MRLLRSAVCVLALAAPFAIVPPPAGAATPPVTPAVTAPPAAVSPEPQQLVQRPDGFPITPVVGLVRTARTDPDAERVVRQALDRAGVKTVSTTDGADPGTPTTIWLGRNPSVLRSLQVKDSTGLPAEGYVLAVGRDRNNRAQVVLDGIIVE